MVEVIVGTTIREWTTGTNHATDGHIDIWTLGETSWTTKTNQYELGGIAPTRARLPLEGAQGLDRLPVDLSPGDLDLFHARFHVNLDVVLGQERNMTIGVRRRDGRDLDHPEPAPRIQIQGLIVNDTRRRNIAHAKKRSAGGKRRKKER